MLESLLLYPIKMAFAGLWAFIFSWGLGVAIIIGLLAAAYFTTAVPFIGPYLKDARSHLLWAAFVVAVFLAGQYTGAHNATKRHEAQQTIVEQTVDKALDNAKKDKSKDKWDRPEYLK
jgi:hypothetical protein